MMAAKKSYWVERQETVYDKFKDDSQEKVVKGQNFKLKETITQNFGCMNLVQKKPSDVKKTTQRNVFTLIA